MTIPAHIYVWMSKNIWKYAWINIKRPSLEQKYKNIKYSESIAMLIHLLQFINFYTLGSR